jgi:hypothetical protein
MSLSFRENRLLATSMDRFREASTSWKVIVSDSVHTGLRPLPAVVVRT